MGEKIGISPQEIVRDRPEVEQLSLYVVKGAGALHPDSLRITTTGVALDTWQGVALSEPVEDRGIVLLHAIPPENKKRRTDQSTWQYTSQLHNPRLVLVKPDILSDGTVICNAPGMETLPLTETQMPQELPGGSVDLFDATLHNNGFNDLGDTVSNWFSKFLQTPCRAVRFRPDTSFENKSKYHKYTLPLRGADDAQMLLMNEASVADLNERLGGDQRVSMDAFRPNITLAGLPAYEEDMLQEILIGNVPVTIVKPCIRCAVTMVDETTGTRRKDGQPLNELSTYRLMKEDTDGRIKTRGVALGVYGTVLSAQNQESTNLTITVGDELKILQSSPSPLPFHALS
ncbi:MAG TPA: MOSC domain-containing protein [Candidatus Saccharimonadales bacterium]|nr:MOSC domain-containing protein [Candidatus Saccharimonadales bacterium]